MAGMIALRLFPSKQLKATFHDYRYEQRVELIDSLPLKENRIGFSGSQHETIDRFRNGEVSRCNAQIYAPFSRRIGHSSRQRDAFEIKSVFQVRLGAPRKG